MLLQRGTACGLPNTPVGHCASILFATSPPLAETPASGRVNWVSMSGWPPASVFEVEILKKLISCFACAGTESTERIASEATATRIARRPLGRRDRLPALRVLIAFVSLLVLRSTMVCGPLRVPVMPPVAAVVLAHALSVAPDVAFPAFLRAAAGRAFARF